MKHWFRTAFCMVLALAVALPLCASAESMSSSDEALQQVYQIIAERYPADCTPFSIGERVSVPGIIDFSVNSVNYYAEDDGTMRVAVDLSVAANKAFADGISLTDYDFILLEDPDGSAPVYHLPSVIYGVIGKHVQPFAWPIYVYPDEPINLLVTYVVPVGAISLKLIETNIMDYGEGLGMETQGSLHVLSLDRHPADFNFHNDSSATVTGIYVIPSDGEGWGDNILAQYADPKLDAGKWMSISFLGGPYASSAAEMWDMKVELSDGNTVFFTSIPLTTLIELSMVDGVAEGKFTLSY